MYLTGGFDAVMVTAVCRADERNFAPAEVVLGDTPWQAASPRAPHWCAGWAFVKKQGGTRVEAAEHWGVTRPRGREAA